MIDKETIDRLREDLLEARENEINKAYQDIFIITAVIIGFITAAWNKSGGLFILYLCMAMVCGIILVLRVYHLILLNRGKKDKIIED